MIQLYWQIIDEIFIFPLYFYQIHFCNLQYDIRFNKIILIVK